MTQLKLTERQFIPTSGICDRILRPFLGLVPLDSVASATYSQVQVISTILLPTSKCNHGDLGLSKSTDLAYASLASPLAKPPISSGLSKSTDLAYASLASPLAKPPISSGVEGGFGFEICARLPKKIRGPPFENFFNGVRLWI